MSSQSACNVVHIAMTPLAGSPIRIVQSLNAYTNIKARLLTVNDYSVAVGRSYPMDLCWWKESDREQFLSLLEAADIIHLHHWLNLDNNPLGIQFSNYLHRGKKIIRQFHSNPKFIAQHSNMTTDAILNDPLPQLTLPQFHERYYPRARLAPNIVPIDDALYANAVSLPTSAFSIYYRPSTLTDAWADRWETKGAPQVMHILNWAAKNIPDICIDAELKGLPYEEHMHRRAQFSLTIDDVVTGSFHLTSLEALAQGRAVICYLDARQLLTLTRFTQCHEIPFINFPLEDLAMLLGVLAKNKTLVQQLGLRGRQWMERYWHPQAMVVHYTTIYDDLLLRGPEAFSLPRFDIDDVAARWVSSESEDVRWLLRRTRMAKSVVA